MCLGRATGIAAGCLADLAFGDPQRGHPVALFGRGAAGFERLTYSDDPWVGAVHTGALLGALTVAGVVGERVAYRRGPAWVAALTAATTFVALGGTSLTRTGARMADLLTRDDIDAARGLLPSLCGRDPAVLDADGLTRAAVESVAENTSDAVVGPLVWGAIAGLPGLVGYRAVNTLDAMVGHRSERYQAFGWAAARLDDAANLAPARLTALLTVLAAKRPRQAAAAWWRDGHRHPSPNAGQCEAAFAGALGVRLGGRNTYAGRVEDRPHLNEAGRPPEPPDIRAAARLSTVVSLAALAIAIGRRIKR
jgi:adenosylcobinamide-phosphate synthase